MSRLATNSRWHTTSFNHLQRQLKVMTSWSCTVRYFLSSWTRFSLFLFFTSLNLLHTTFEPDVCRCLSTSWLPLMVHIHFFGCE
jgi:hypothetical protein